MTLSPWDDLPSEELIPVKRGDNLVTQTFKPADFAAALRKSREANGMSLEALSARANVKQSSLQAYESGRFWPPVVHAQMLADALGTRIPILLGLEQSDLPTDAGALSPEALALLTLHVNEIDSLKRALEVARASEHRWMNLAEAVAEGIMLHDGQKVIDVNPRFAELFGYERKAVLGDPIINFVAPESRPLVVKQIRAGSSDSYEILGLANDGRKVRVRVRPRVLKNGLRIAAFSIIRPTPL